MTRHGIFLLAAISALAFLLGAPATAAPATAHQLSAQLAGTASGTVNSNPAGISCAPTCSASFTSGTVVKLTDSSFDGLPQFNPASGITPLYGPPPTNPGCDPAYPVMDFTAS